MKVLFWAKSPCIRTYKEAKGLRDNGVRTVLAYSGKTLEARYSGLRSEDAFDDVVQMSDIYPYHFVEDEAIEIIHTAHPPDSSVRELIGCGTPIIHDFHDLDSLFGADEVKCRHEKDAALNASGLVYVGKMMADYVAEKYPCRAAAERLVMNAADDIKFEKASRPWPKEEIHVVYAAAMPRWGDGHFRDIKQYTAQLTGHGIHFHVHALIVEPGLKAEEEINAHFHIERQCTGSELLSLLSRYDAGIIPHRASTAKEQRHVNMSVPNKIFEYWQVGIPVLALSSKETNSLIRQYEIGTIVSSFKDIRRFVNAPYRPRRNVITMREEAQKLISLYEEVQWL